jgi:hypothetical protein
MNKTAIVMLVAAACVASVFRSQPVAAATVAALPCTAKQLQASDASVKDFGARRLAHFDVFNNSPNGCTISGYPQLEFQRFGGALAPVTINRTSVETDFRTPAPSTITLAPLGHASFLLGFPKRDLHGSPCAPISNIVISGFAGNGTVTIPDTIAPCTTLSVSPYFVTHRT